MQEGKYVGKLIAARLAGDEKAEPFKYFDKGSMATIGHRSAIADAFGMQFTGVLGYTMWGFIHVLYLIGWGNRLGTLYTWARALTFSRNRGHRLITFEQAHDRAEETRDAPPVTPAVPAKAAPAGAPPSARAVDLAVARVAAGALHGLEEHPPAEHVGVEVAELAAPSSRS